MWTHDDFQRTPLYPSRRSTTASLGKLLECLLCYLSNVANDLPCVVIFGIEEAVKEAQNGGSGVVIYFRKEGRALGEVTKVGSMHT